MEAPRALRKTENGEICEVDDPRARFIFCGQGTPLSAEDAKQVADYLKEHDKSKANEMKSVEEVEEKAAEKPEAKAVEQSEVEDKSMKWPVEQKASVAEVSEPDESEESKTGAQFPSEVRRGPGRPPRNP